MFGLVTVAVILHTSLRQRPSLVTVVEWIDYETLALLFGMVRPFRRVRTRRTTQSETDSKNKFLSSRYEIHVSTVHLTTK